MYQYNKIFIENCDSLSSHSTLPVTQNVIIKMVTEQWLVLIRQNGIETSAKYFQNYDDVPDYLYLFTIYPLFLITYQVDQRHFSDTFHDDVTQGS